MKKIVLTEDEKKVIKQYFKHEFDQFTANEYQMKYFGNVIDKASDFHFESGSDEDFGDDLIVWFWRKYQEQNKKENKNE